MFKPVTKLILILLAGLFFTASNAIGSSSISSWNIYYGNLHNHTTVSDGSGSPDQAYDYAKNVAGLDFFSTADHAEATTSTEYNTVKNAADVYNEDGVFTAFWGFEWSSSFHGHVAVIYSDDICRSSESTTDTFSELLTWLSSRETIAFFNHPGREANAFEHYDGTISDKFAGMELWNKTVAFEEYYYNDGFHSGDGNMGHYDEALLRGWKIGAGGGEDNHWASWGTWTDYRVAILADNLSRADLYAAMKARRYYSTLDKNLGLYFEMDTQPMGSEIAGGSNFVVIEANDADNEIVSSVELLKNGVVINTWYPDSSQPYITDTVSSTDGDYFYCRIMQADGDEAVSSPIYISGGGQQDLDPPNPDPMTWAIPPQATDSTTITMTATTASDPSGIEYYFTCVAGNCSDSGWQSGTTYTDSGLTPNTQYTYTVIARDLSTNLNETAASSPASATTPDVINTPPVFTSNPIAEADGTENVFYSSSIADDAYDPDPGDALTFYRISGPSWLNVAQDGSLSGTPGAGDIGLNSWTIRVEDTSADFDEAYLEITVNEAAQDVDFMASGESTSMGSVSGDFTDTQSNDNIYEALTEGVKAGKWSKLDHIWTFNITGNATVIFMVEAFHSSNSENDDFTFSWSTDNVVFNDMLTITATTDDNTMRSFELPTYTSGTIYIRVTDTDNTRGNTSLETLYVDEMLIRTSASAQAPGTAFSPGPADGAINVDLNAQLTWAAGAGAEWHDVYLGTTQGNLALVSTGQIDTTYNPGSLSEGTTYFWRIDEENNTGTTTGTEWSFTTYGGTCNPSTIRVDSIETNNLKGSAGRSFGQAIVNVIDNCGNAVSGADVTGHFTGDFIGEPQQIQQSDQNGQTVFTTTTEIKKPSYSFIVDDVSASGLTWIP